MNWLSVNDLRKLCRVCLGNGELDVLKHVIRLPSEESGRNENSESISQNVNAQEMLSVFSQRQFTEMEQNVNADQLICRICLDKLIQSFLFYRKVEEADKKLDAFWTNAVIDTDQDIIEQEVVEYLEEQSENYDENRLSTLQNTKNADLINEEDHHKDNRNITQNSALEILKNGKIEKNLHQSSVGLKRRRIIKNPKFVLTDGVTQILAHVNNSNRSTFDLEENLLMSSTSIDATIPQKRCKTRERRKCKLEQGSFVITQFIPSNVQIETLQNNLQIDGEDSVHTTENPMAGNELRTMDYAAVEVEAHASDLNDNEHYSISTAIETATAMTAATVSNDGTSSCAVYMCKYCPQAFSAADFLITHVRKQHVCKYCTQAFAKSTDLYEHIRSSHSDHKCAICGKELSTHSNLRSHIRRVHGLKLPAQVALLHYRPLPTPDMNKQNVSSDGTHLDDFQSIDCLKEEAYLEEQPGNVLSS